MPNACHAIHLPQGFQLLLSTYCIKGILLWLVFKAYIFFKFIFHYYSPYIQCFQPNYPVNNPSLCTFVRTVTSVENAVFP